MSIKAQVKPAANRRGPRRRWNVIEPPVFAGTRSVEFDCPHCGYEALLPIAGDNPVLASTAGGLIFDRPPPYGAPDKIRCSHCRHTFAVAVQ